MAAHAPIPGPRDHLGTFEDRDVLRAAVAITHAGDGLSEALLVDPSVHRIGDQVYVLLECAVADVRFVPADKDDPDMGVVRRHTLRAGTATILPAEVARPKIAAQRKAIDEARGVHSLPIEDDTAEADQAADGDGTVGEVRSLRQRRRGGAKPEAE